MTSRPFMSVVVPTRDRLEQLAECLEALAGQDYPRDRFEVLVVDDGGSRRAAALAARFGDRLNFRLLRQRHAGPAVARNTAVDQARGEYLAFTDDDCLPAPDWLSELAATCVRLPDHAIGGRTVNGFPSNSFSAVSQMILDVVYAHFQNDPSGLMFFTTTNLAVSTSRLRELGGFDGQFSLLASEDRELCDRWQRHGYQLTYAPDCVVYHQRWLTMGSLIRQQFKYGRGGFRFSRVRANRGAPPLRPHIRFYLKLLWHPARQYGWARSLWMAALLIVAQAGYAAGVFWQWTLERQGSSRGHAAFP